MSAFKNIDANVGYGVTLADRIKQVAESLATLYAEQAAFAPNVEDAFGEVVTQADYDQIVKSAILTQRGELDKILAQL